MAFQGFFCLSKGRWKITFHNLWTLKASFAPKGRGKEHFQTFMLKQLCGFLFWPVSQRPLFSFKYKKGLSLSVFPYFDKNKQQNKDLWNLIDLHGQVRVQTQECSVMCLFHLWPVQRVSWTIPNSFDLIFLYNILLFLTRYTVSACCCT